MKGIPPENSPPRNEQHILLIEYIYLFCIQHSMTQDKIFFIFIFAPPHMKPAQGLCSTVILQTPCKKFSLNVRPASGGKDYSMRPQQSQSALHTPVLQGINTCCLYKQEIHLSGRRVETQIATKTGEPLPRQCPVPAPH